MSFADRPGAARRVVGFRRDDEGHWAAELECGHRQHMRHEPPLVSRPWVLTEEGRAAFLGRELRCVHCVGAFMHFLLFYDVSADYLALRGSFRAEHLGLARAAHARGELVLAGALADPVDGAVLLFRGDSPAVAERFAESDPYVRQGLVTAWRVRPWTTVVGDEPAVPVP